MVRTQNIRLPHSVVSIWCIKMSTLHCCNSVFVDLPCHLVNKLQQAACTQNRSCYNTFPRYLMAASWDWNWISPYFVIVLLSCCSWPCPNLSLSLCPPAQVRSLCPRRSPHCPKYQTTEVWSSLIFFLTLRYLSLRSGNRRMMVVKVFTHVFQEQHPCHTCAIMLK